MVEPLHVITQEGNTLKEVELDFSFLDGLINESLVFECIRMYRCSARQGNASTKTRGEIVGSTAKPWKQKGTGRARSGTRKSPIWRGGGVVFGPRPRSYRFNMPKKMKKLALLSALRSRFKTNNLLVLDDWKLEDHKTSSVRSIIKKMSDSFECMQAKKILLVTSGKNDLLLKSTSNIPGITVIESNIFNALDVVANDSIVFTEKAFVDLGERLSLNKEGVN